MSQQSAVNKLELAVTSESKVTAAVNSLATRSFCAIAQTENLIQSV